MLLLVEACNTLRCEAGCCEGSIYTTFMLLHTAQKHGTQYGAQFVGRVRRGGHALRATLRV